MKHIFSNTTAILVFSRTARQEAFVKNFHASASFEQNVKIAQHFIQHTLQTAKNTGLPVISKFSDLQRGASFGERLANAIEDVFSSGYQQLIVLGNDCPELSTNLINTAAKTLEENGLVLGPAKDGGLYLLGFSKNTYNRESFLDLSWEGKDLSADFLNYATQLECKLTWLQEYCDVDSSRDFLWVLKKLSRGKRIRKVLMSLIQIISNSYSPFKFNYTPLAFQNTIGLRAPPFFKPCLAFIRY